MTIKMASKIIDDPLQDPKNWIRVESRGMKKVNELEIATIVYDTAKAELSDIKPDDILGA